MNVPEQGWVAMGKERRLRADPDYQGQDRRASEPSLNEVVEVTHSGLGKWAGISVSLVTLGGFIFAGANMWFQSDAEAQEAHAAIRSEIVENRERIGKVENRLDSIDRNQARTINLQLKAEARALREEIAKAQPGQGRSLLQTQLDRVEAELGAN